MCLRIVNIRSLSGFVLLSISIISIFLFASSYFYESAAKGNLSEKFVSAARDTKLSVVNIRAIFKVAKRGMLDRGKRFEVKGQGSGVIADKEGYIITNNHVVKGTNEIIVRLYDGSEYKAELVGRDQKTDIAVLKIDAENLQPAVFGDSNSLKVGEIVLAIGSNFGLGQTVTSGIISARGRANVQIAEHEDFLQTDATINSGNSGGPLVNLKGEVVGINTAITTQRGGYLGINFAIPINMARSIIEDLITYGKVKRGWFGVTVQAVTPQLQEILGLKDNLGALVSDIEPNSPAAEAGLKTGDVIIEFDGKKIKDLFSLRNLVTRSKINKKIKLVVIRNGERLMLDATIVERTSGDKIDEKDLFEHLGLIVQTLTPELAINLGYKKDEKGVVITNIKIGSPAFNTGLKKGDLIVEVQHKPISNINDFHQIILDRLNEDTLILVKRRDGTSSFKVLKAK